MKSTTVTVGDLAALVRGRVRGDPSVVITSVTHDSRSCGPGSLFCCVPGRERDGHEFAAEAVERGAVALLVERTVDLGVPQLVVDDVRSVMAVAAAEVLGHPADRLRIVGVTGTNGKTTVVSMIGHVLTAVGRQVGVIGTLTGERTTPEAPELQVRLAEFVEDGVTDVAMEVSSHALALHRVDGMEFDVAVFTNLGADHLDFHRTPEAYFASKARLFEPDRTRAAVVNVDDVHGRLLMDTAEYETVGYSLGDVADLVTGPDGSSFRWRARPVQLALAGRHNVSNAIAAAEACRLLGVDEDEIAAALAGVPPIPGRFEAVQGGQPFVVMVDFAHTPDALEQALGAARGLLGSGGRLAVVFGCGGMRDPGKRPLMGEIACRLADAVILTTDNPRSEDPLRILSEIRGGCPGEDSPRSPVTEPDRRRAITRAIGEAGPGDVVLIAGKGHEAAQIFADRTEPFDDRQAAQEALAALGYGGDGA